MSRYRIKTEEEFLENFGECWRSEVPAKWNSNGEMDFLFGMSVPSYKVREIYLYGRSDFQDWEISKEMLIKTDDRTMMIDEEGNIKFL